MNKRISKFISLILVFALIMSCGVTTAFAVATSYDRRTTKVPTIYVQGYGQEIYSDGWDNTSDVIVGGDVPFLTDGVLGDLLVDLIDPLWKGIATGNYKEYNDTVVNALVADLSRFALDKNGEASDGSGNFYRRETVVLNKNWNDGEYYLFDYSLYYDWRVDPFLTASELDDYIQLVKAATGFDKVNLVGRCLGANIVLAYLAEYGYEDVNAVNFYVGGLDGFEAVGALFSGKVVVDPDALDKFLQSAIEDDEDGLVSFLKSILGIFNFVNGLNLPIDVLTVIYNQVYTDIIPRVLRETFGTLPAFWSFVGNDYYDAAMALNFPTAELQAEYAGLITKLERYHNQVALRTEEIIKEATESGVAVYFTAKYGFPAMPLCEEANLHSDGTVSVTSQSFGATSSPVGKVFSETYIQNAKKNGTDKYISPDKYIDASTAILPDHVWFVKGSSHAVMHESIDVMMADIFNATGIGEKYVTVDDIADYPQFLLLEAEENYNELVPLTKENASMGADWNVGVVDHLSNLITRTFDFIFEFIEIVVDFIEKLQGSIG